MAYSTISKPSLHFNSVLYVGNGGTKNVTGVGFQPDFCWLKVRDGSSSHALFDVIRGVQKRLVTNDSAAQLTQSGLTSFDTDGFTLGSQGAINGNGGNHVAWNWKANGAGSVNNDGTTASTVSVNTTAGFSLIKYSGNSSTNSVGHGLGVKPSFFITKGYDATNGWVGWHKGLTGSSETDRYIYLNSTAAQGATSGYWAGGGGITTSTIGLWTSGGDNNTSGRNYIMYAFAEKKGFSKFGSYTGNGNADGTFVYTGFKPAFILVKRTDSSTGGSWILYDNKRGNNVRNPVDVIMAASNNQSESDWGTAFDCDFLSNGIKWRYNGAAGYSNTSGASYIYMAFAEEPLVANVGQSIPATAR